MGHHVSWITLVYIISLVTSNHAFVPLRIIKVRGGNTLPGGGPPIRPPSPPASWNSDPTDPLILPTRPLAAAASGDPPPFFVAPAPVVNTSAAAAAASSTVSKEEEVHHKSFFQSLRSWIHFKAYCGRIRDLLLIAKPVEKALYQTGVLHDADLARFMGRIVAYIVYSLLLTSCLGTMGIDTKPLVAGIGVSGFVVGFALKEVATNLLSGILLVLQRPFKTGWKIKVGSHVGTVQQIDSRYVRLLTDSNEQILLPSYQVYSSAIIVVEKKPPK